VRYWRRHVRSRRPSRKRSHQAHRGSPGEPNTKRLGLLLGIAAVIAASVLLLTTEGGSTHSRVRQRHASHHVARHAGPSLRQVMARGNAWIRRTAALGLPIWCAGKRGRDVAFTFDDGPGPYTRLVLKKLRRAHERATFFDVGVSMEAWPGPLRSELKQAAIGDHTYSHPDLVRLPPGEIQFQLQRAQQMIQAKSGEHVDLFRAPYGASNATVESIAKRLGLLEIMWTQDSRDSLGANWSQIVENVKNGLHPGAIILFHENHGQTVRALTTLLPLLHRLHLRSVSLPQLFAVDPPSVGLIRRGYFACWPPDKVPKPIGGD
jgi:peptidoglycan/xylan/chitin deacetylase (PgdA/CDA1 family)